jgi:hypothetical protein
MSPERIMKRQTSRWSALAAGVALLTQATTGFAGPFHSIEEAVESTSDVIVLPQATGSTLVVTPCAGCAPLSIPSTARSVYLLKRTPVTLAEFQQALAGKHGVMVTVFRSTANGELTRVIAELDPAPLSKAR